MSVLVWNLGLGVDSTAMAARGVALGIKPDLCIFADTGGEKPETYAYRDVLEAWLVERGWPPIIVARRPLLIAPYATLEENCIANETLPGLAFGKRNCSQKWKHEAMDRWIFGVRHGRRAFRCAPGLPAAAEIVDAGGKIEKWIGYDAGPKDMRRGKEIADDPRVTFRYPLREWGWDRERCIVEIIKAGLPVPLKSACFYCPASQPWEVWWLAGAHPDLFLRAIAMEDNARAGVHGLGDSECGRSGGVAGLWRHVSWRRWAEREGILDGGRIAMSGLACLVRAASEKPEMEANVCC